MGLSYSFEVNVQYFVIVCGGCEKGLVVMDSCEPSWAQLLPEGASV